MLRAELEHRFDVPVETGFSFADPANWPQFWPAFVRIEPGSRWSVPEDEARIVVRLLVRSSSG